MNIKWNIFYSDREETNISDSLDELNGEVIASVTGAEVDSESIIITTESGKAIEVYHSHDCCESVSVEDVEADEITGGVVLFAGFVSGESPSVDDEWCESYTWTFMKVDTNKGSIWVRWFGESNGYYSETPAVRGGRVLS